MGTTIQNGLGGVTMVYGGCPALPPGAAPPAPAAPSSPRDTATVERTAAGLRAVIERAASGALDRAALGTACGKMCGGLSALAGAATLEDAVANMLLLQRRQGDARGGAAERSVKDRLQSIEASTKQRIAEIHRRAEAESNKSWWDKLLSVFKAIVTGVVAIASACTGGVLGAAGGALLISSLAVKLTQQNQTGMWVSLGLDMAGGALGALGGGIDLSRFTAPVQQQVLRGADELVGLPRGHYAKQELLAAATIKRLEADTEWQRGGLDSDREQLQHVVDAQQRGTNLVLRFLEKHDAVRTAVVQRG